MKYQSHKNWDDFELITNNFWVEFQQEIFLLVSQNLLAQKEQLSQQGES